MVDASSHREIFSPEAFGERRVDVIGAGATGSRVVLSLAKLGIQNIHVWDFDKIEEHNIANQVYDTAHIGQLKVEALAEIVKRSTGTVITQYPFAADGSKQLGNVVFLMTDTMRSRKEIWGKAIKLKPHVSLMIETRMGTDNGRIYSIVPFQIQHVRMWEETLYDDAEAGVEVAACGTNISVGPSAEIVSGLAVWQLMRWFAHDQGKSEDVPEHEIIFGLRSSFIMGRSL
ncbi:MAG TPA: ThiF family adenylyltransferase [Verrucomicrobiae bacterium]|nr:ThiF family adenylyltransferase [Verrucomicrobiae bacterium]